MRLDQDADALPYLTTAREYFKKAKEPERVYCTDEFLTIAYTALENGVEAVIHGQKSLDFAITAQNKYYETWAHYRLGRAQVLMGELEDAEEHLRTAISMNTSSCHPDWDLALDAETEVADIYTTLGRTDEAEEIMRRLKTLEEVMDSDDDKK